MRFLRYCLLFALLIMAPAAAWGATCTFGAGISTLGPIDTVTGEDHSCAPSDITADDTVVCDGCTLSITDDIVLDGSGTNATCIQVINGGELTIDVSGHTTAPDTLGIETFQGCSVGAYGNVSLYVDSTSTLNIQGGWLQNGEDATPAVVTDDLGDNWTVWTVDTIIPCAGDCVTYPNLECFLYSDSRSNVEDTYTGESFLPDALAAITSGEMQMRLMDLDGEGAAPLEFPRSYPITVVDSTGPDYSFCVDITEPGWETGGYRTEDLDGYPVAYRQIVATTLAAAADVGDTCVTVAGTAIGSDGLYVGRWFRPSGESYRPYRIMWSTDGVDCDGGAAGDALYLADDTPIYSALASASDATIDYGFRRGDTFGVGAYVIVSGSDNAGLSDADQKIVIEGTANIDGLQVHGAGELRFNGATIQKLKDVHLRDTGADGYAALAFEDVSGVRASIITTMGGDGSTQGASGQAAAVLFDDVAGAIRIDDSSFRYFGDGGFITSGTTATGSVTGSRLVFEHILSDATNSGPLQFASDDLARVALSDVVMADAVIGTGGDAVEAGSNSVYIDRLSVLGQVDGGLGTGAGLQLNNYYAERIESAITGTIASANANVLPIRANNIEIHHLDATAATWPLNPYTSQYRNFIFDDIESAEDTNGLFVAGRDQLAENGIFWNVNTTNSDCETTSACQLIQFSFDGDTGTVDTFRRVTFGWTPGVTNRWTYLIAETGGSGVSNEDSFNFGSISMFNFTNGYKNSGTVSAIYSGSLQTALGAGIVDMVGPVCLQANVASGGGTVAYTDATAPLLAAFGASNLYRGYVHPRFEDVTSRKYSFVKGSLADILYCGALTGNQQPGVNRSVMQFGFSAIGGSTEMRPLIVRDRGVY